MKKKPEPREVGPLWKHYDPTPITLALVVGAGAALGIVVWILYAILERTAP